MDDTGVHLTTTRIFRAFRPLRTKCLALSEPIATTQLRHHAPVTYGSSSRQQSHDHAASVANLAFSFTPLPTIDRLPMHPSWSRDTIRALSPLIRKINEVRDAFRNVLKVATGGWPDQSPTSIAPSCVRSLTSICASAVGEIAEDYAEACLEESTGTKEDMADMEALDELYETIPPHYRW